VGPEASGRLALDSLGGVVLFSELGLVDVAQGASLLTSSDPGSPAGLKVNTTFSVRGIFDLVLPPPGQESGYAIVLLDCPSVTDLTTCGDKELSVGLHRRGDGSIAVRFEQFNFLDTGDLQTEIPLSAGDLLHQQIGFDLVKASSSSTAIQADYFFVDSGSASAAIPFPVTYDTFDVHNWTRASFSADGVFPATDGDGDGIPDAVDDCPYYASANRTDTDHNRRGDVCECGDQNLDGRVDVRDMVAINLAIFTPGLATPLCDANGDGRCNVSDIVAVNNEIFSPTNTSTCARQPVPGP
jgi:hypothetical protein